MAIDLSISNWVDKVPNQQWNKDDNFCEEIGYAIPNMILESKPLAEVHRLDLSLFVIFEEAAVRVSGSLTRSAPDQDAINFSAQQTLDEARHLEIFMDRLNISCEQTGKKGERVDDQMMIPPLKKFLDHCYEIVDRGQFIEGLTLMNLILEGMAYPLYSYERRYWKPIDPLLEKLIRSAYIDESRHVMQGAQVIKRLLANDTKRKEQVRKLYLESGMLMGEVFDYYINKFVKLFDTVAKMHKETFADTEFEQGRLISETPYQEQVRCIRESIEKQHQHMLGLAGLD